MTTPTTTDTFDQYEHQRKAFHVHATVFAATMVLIFAVNLLVNLAAGITGDLGTWWFAWALLGWGIGIAVHGLVVRLNRPAGYEAGPQR